MNWRIILVGLAQVRLLLCGRTPAWVACARDVSLYHTVLHWNCTLCTLTSTDRVLVVSTPEHLSSFSWLWQNSVFCKAFIYKYILCDGHVQQVACFDSGFGCAIMGWWDSASLHTLHEHRHERGLTNPRCRGQIYFEKRRKPPHSWHRRWMIIGGHCKLSKKILRKLRSREPETFSKTHWHCIYWVIVWDMEQPIHSTKEVSFEPLRTCSFGRCLYLVAQNIPTSSNIRIWSIWYFPPNRQPILCVWLQYWHVSEGWFGCWIRFGLIPFTIHIHQIHRRSINIGLSYPIIYNFIIIPSHSTILWWNMWNLLRLLRRCIVVAADQCCEICGADAMSERFYAFTCTHCCHEACLRPSDLQWLVSSLPILPSFALRTFRWQTCKSCMLVLAGTGSYPLYSSSNIM